MWDTQGWFSHANQIFSIRITQESNPKIKNRNCTQPNNIRYVCMSFVKTGMIKSNFGLIFQFQNKPHTYISIIFFLLYIDEMTKPL